MNTPTDSPNSFHLQEYVSLRANILSLVDQVNQVEKYVVIGTAVVYSWLAIHNAEGGSLSHNMFWFLPLFFTILGSLKVYMLKNGILKIGRYIHRLEEVCGLAELGWEHFRAADLGKEGRASQSYLVFSYAFWGTLYLSNLVVPMLVMFGG